MGRSIELCAVSKTFDLVREKHGSLKAAVLSFKKASHSRLLALNNITLSIEAGQAVAIIGRNGSGKSTLLRIIGRVYKPTSGTVRVNGRMSTMLDPGAGFHPELTGRENVFFSGSIMGLSTPEMAARVDRVISFSELNDFVDSPVKTYSEGMLMRLGFAIAVETDPDILLIDESLAVGDAEFQAKCYDRIAEFSRNGGTIVFSTHDLPAAQAVATRTIWLHKGDVKADGSTAEAIESYLASTAHHDRPHH